MADGIVDLPGEIWKSNILADGDLILVSSLGRVKTRDRVIAHGRHPCLKRIKGRLCKPYVIKGKHLAVKIQINGKSPFRYVHRLVCAAFHGPPPPDLR